MTSKVRIVEITNVDGTKEYQIQQRHFIFLWWWVPAWVNTIDPITDTFPTLEGAKSNLCFFDGTKAKYKVVQ